MSIGASRVRLFFKRVCLGLALICLLAQARPALWAKIKEWDKHMKAGSSLQRQRNSFRPSPQGHLLATLKPIRFPDDQHERQRRQRTHPGIPPAVCTASLLLQQRARAGQFIPDPSAIATRLLNLHLHSEIAQLLGDRLGKLLDIRLHSLLRL
jgi:hypothetical protein